MEHVNVCSDQWRLFPAEKRPLGPRIILVADSAGDGFRLAAPDRRQLAGFERMPVNAATVMAVVIHRAVVTRLMSVVGRTHRKVRLKTIVIRFPHAATVGQRAADALPGKQAQHGQGC